MKNGNNYTIIFSKLAMKDKTKLKSANLEKNCKSILDLMLKDPFCYPPKYEKLLGDLTGFYTRRINRQHRIVYKVDEDSKTIYIYRMWTHYE